MIIYRFSNKNFKEQKLKKQEQKELIELVNYLNFASKAEQNLILEKALKKAGYFVEKVKSNLYIKDKNSLIILKFGFAPVTKVDIVKAYNQLAVTDKAYIIAESFEQPVLQFANRFNGRVLCHTGQDVFSFLKKHQSLPMAKYTEFLEKKKKGNVKILLDKKKSKTFLTFGIFFLAMSYFSPIKTYYLIVGCAFSIYAVILRAFGKDVRQQEKPF